MSKNYIKNFGQWLAENKRTPMGARLNEAESGEETEIKEGEYTSDFLKKLETSLLNGTNGFGSYWVDSKKPFINRLASSLSSANTGKLSAYKLTDLKKRGLNITNYNLNHLDKDDIAKGYTSQIIYVKPGDIKNPDNINDPSNYIVTDSMGYKTSVTEEIIKKHRYFLFSETEVDGKTEYKPISGTKGLAFIKIKFKNTDSVLFTQNLSGIKPDAGIDWKTIKCTIDGKGDYNLVEAFVSPKGGNDNDLSYTSTESFKKGVTEYIASIGKEKEKVNNVPVLLAVKAKLPGCKTIEEAIGTAKGKELGTKQPQ